MHKKLTSILHRTSSFAAFLAAASFLSVVLAPSAQAGGVHDIPLTSIPLARSPIVMDGSLADWPDTPPVTFVPVAPGLAKAGSAALAQLRRRPAAATLQASYNSKALYFGI